MSICTDNCASLSGIKCFQPSSYFDWRVPPFKYSEEKTPGISQELLYTSLISILYIGLLFLFECGICKRIWIAFVPPFNIKFNTRVNDDDVTSKKERVSNLIQQGKSSEEAIVVSNLSKNYRNLSAVSNITFGVHYGECFGLIGVNGAGNKFIP